MISIYITYGIMALCESVNLAAALHIIFQCSPVEYESKPDVMDKLYTIYNRATWKADLVAEDGIASHLSSYRTFITSAHP